MHHFLQICNRVMALVSCQNFVSASERMDRNCLNFAYIFNTLILTRPRVGLLCTIFANVQQI